MSPWGNDSETLLRGKPRMEHASQVLGVASSEKVPWYPVSSETRRKPWHNTMAARKNFGSLTHLQMAESTSRLHRKPERIRRPMSAFDLEQRRKKTFFSCSATVAVTG